MTRITRRILAVAVLGLSMGTTACGDDPVAAQPALDIIETARAAGSFGTLLTAVEAAGLTATLQGDGPFTVFAPTDEAFAKLPAGTVQALLQDTQALTAILTYHVVAGAVPASQVIQLSSAKTLNGQSVSITVDNGTVRLNGVRVVQTDIEASNGVIHVIDEVLLPN